MDHGTRDKSARLILASVPVQALLMAGVLALAVSGRSAAPAPDGAYFVKPAPPQGPAICRAAVLSPQGTITKLSGPVPCRQPPAQGPAVCKVPVFYPQGASPGQGAPVRVVELTGPAADGSQIDSKVLAIGSARCAVGSVTPANDPTQPGKQVQPAAPAQP